MALSQRKFREVVLQLLYSHDLAQPESDEVIPFMMDELKVAKSNMRQAHDRMALILQYIPELDGEIAETAKEYDLDRIQKVDRNIMRLALFELFYDEGVPHRVAIAEGIRLARKYSTPEAAKFINGILDHIYKENFPKEKGEDKSEIFFREEEKR